MRKTDKSDSDFLWWTPPAQPAKTNRGPDMTKSLIEPRAKVLQSVPKLSNEAFSKIIYFMIDIYCAVPWTSCVVTSTEGALCQSFTLVSLDWTGQILY